MLTTLGDCRVEDREPDHCRRTKATLVIRLKGGMRRLGHLEHCVLLMISLHCIISAEPGKQGKSDARARIADPYFSVLGGEEEQCARVPRGLRRVCGVGRPVHLALLRRACTTSLPRTCCECLFQHSRSPSPLFASYEAFSGTSVTAATCYDSQKLPGAP